jgi:serine/threonine protein kinase
VQDRPTLKSGLPAALRDELGALVGTLHALADGRRWRLGKLLGRSAIYVTFAATRIDRGGAAPMVLKLVRPSLLAAWPDGAHLLTRSLARVLSIMNARFPSPPSLARVVDVGALGPLPERGLTETTPFVALEDRYPGETESMFAAVRDRFAREGIGAPPALLRRWVRAIGRGLDAAHVHGLVHRGLSPKNVLLRVEDPHATAWLTDAAIARPEGLPIGFGVADEREGDVDARGPYLAPEQLKTAGALGPASDVFAFAQCVRFALRGRPPRRGDRPLADEPALHPFFQRGAPLEAIERWLEAASANDPAARPPIALAFAESLDDALERADRSRASRAPSPTPAAAPAAATARWVVSERARPSQPIALVAAAMHDDGQALAIDRAGQLHAFDGLALRTVASSLVARARTVQALDGRAFVIGGDDASGLGAAAVLDAEGEYAIPLGAGERLLFAAGGGGDDTVWIARRHASGQVSVTAVSRRDRLVQPLASAPTVDCEGLIDVHGLAPLDARLAVVLGLDGTGSAVLGLVELSARRFRLEARPARGLLGPLASDPVAAPGRAWLGAHPGRAFELSLGDGERARLRHVATNTHLVGAPVALSIRARTRREPWVRVLGEDSIVELSFTDAARELWRDSHLGARVIAGAVGLSTLTVMLADGRVLAGGVLS